MANAGARPLWASALGLLGGAAALWASSSMTWYTRGELRPVRGQVQVPVTGSEAVGTLGPLALLALAAIAAAVALPVWGRRALGLVVLVSVSAAAVDGWTQLGRAAAAPLVLATLGGLLLVVSAVLLVLGAGRMPGMGARYSRRTGPTSASPPAASPPADAPASSSELPDSDRAWWMAMEQGRDPTAEDDEPDTRER